MSRGGVTSKDHGYAALVKRVFEFGHPQVASGILEADGAKEEPGGVTVIEVAEGNEFGTDDIPARSFIRAWFDEAEPQMRADLVTLMKGVVKGTHTKEQVLELLGVKAVGGIQKRIADGIHADPPSGVDLEPGKTPLIKSGQMRGSVSFAVREKG